MLLSILLNLLHHENIDIVVTVIELIKELTDEDEDSEENEVALESKSKFGKSMVSIEPIFPCHNNTLSCL